MNINCKFKFAKSIVFICVLCVILMCVSRLFADKSSEYKYRDFFDEKNNFDVLFFGSSHMEVFVSPLELWNKYGLISYNFGNPEEGFPITYWVINNAIRVNKPRIVVLDTYMFGLGNKYIGEETIHYGLDVFPVNKTKIESINDLVDDNSTKLEMFFTLGNYHYRWKNMNQDFFKNINKCMKGNLSYGYIHTTKINEFIQYPLINTVAHRSDYEYDIDYLNRIIELCKSENIELFLVTNPYICNKERQKLNNLIEVLANENNIPYINMVKMNNIIDTQIDMYDEQHVNQSGMHKVTDYIGSYIVSNYGIENHKEDENYSDWNDSYNDYKMFKYESVMWQDDLDKVLMMLHDNDIDSYVYCDNSYKGYDKDKFNNLMQNIPRKNITVDDTTGTYSGNITPLTKLNKQTKQYLLIKKAQNWEEITGDEAETMISNIVVDFTDEALDYDIVIVFKDNGSDEIRLIQGYNYTDKGYKSENLYSAVRFKYLFKD